MSRSAVVFVWVFALVMDATCPHPVRASEPVQIELPVRAKIDISQHRTLVVVPFLTVSTEESTTAGDVEAELARYLARLVARKTHLSVDTVYTEFPTTDLTALANHELFWQALGERTGADLLLAGAVDFDHQDRSGYVTQEFVSEADGRTYFAQVLVERSGLELDLLIWLVDGRSGRLLLADNFKDFKSFEGEGSSGRGPRAVTPLDGLFASLATLESRLLGIFRQRIVTAERILQ